MGMFELTPDEITAFVKWLIGQDRDPRKFMDEPQSVKRDTYRSYIRTEESTEVPQES